MECTGETPTGAELIEVKTKTEDDDFYPQPTNPGKSPILNPKLEQQSVIF